MRYLNILSQLRVAHWGQIMLQLAVLFPGCVPVPI